MKTHDLSTCEFGFHDITAQVQQDVRNSNVREGLCTVYCPHTTAAITINENADPDVQHDLKLALGDIFGRRDRAEFFHAEGNSHAHLKSSVIGASETIPISNGKLTLGTWQGIYFCEFDGPRHRRFYVQIVGE
ncbi:secondary thiamine-phosphate synthase enzyme YjbQ [Denitrobacterium detoxificans]|jgi:secondary thiamine-phosphate synthase enzyme|uniref:secondary thiamine-phosphate synthase enzyme YjbQ n=1 Tax=Denitrobacterium detoxificans TaxID=79604 RepID=UPI0026F29DDD|nr:secondary thiamine-phosphate synthase enzyme YjbQ [Denitrobacterium detoxificans]MBE6465273.1 YjbQ family protein [Denitrobacterium detoxificans]